jgi:hypothetical protein
MQMSLPSAHKAVIRKQWNFMAEYSRVPGWYMLERELSNCWNNIVLQGENARTAIDDSVSLINKEIKRKMIQFGYLKADGSYPERPIISRRLTRSKGGRQA